MLWKQNLKLLNKINISLNSASMHHVKKLLSHFSCKFTNRKQMWGKQHKFCVSSPKLHPYTTTSGCGIFPSIQNGMESGSHRLEDEACWNTRESTISTPSEFGIRIYAEHSQHPEIWIPKVWVNPNKQKPCASNSSPIRPEF